MNIERNNSNTTQPVLLPDSYYLSRQRAMSYSSNDMQFLPLDNRSQTRDLAYLEKRSVHNALERQRREGLNSKFQELAHVLPTLQQVKRPSKSTIVSKSLEFVSLAPQREVSLQKQLTDLLEENKRLQKRAWAVPKKNRAQKPKQKRESEKGVYPKTQKKIDTRRRSAVSFGAVDLTPEDGFLLESTEHLVSSPFGQQSSLDLLNTFNMQNTTPPYDDTFFWNYKYI